MAFDAYDVSLQVARETRDVVCVLRRLDRDLCRQLQRAVSSVALNVAEGSCRRGKDQIQHYLIAAGSAREACAALKLAEAWGSVDRDRIERPLELLDRVLAMLWRLTH